MTPPPTSIDGTDITGATIDGQEVQSITIDGQEVFSAVSPLDKAIARYEFSNFTTSTWTDSIGSNDLSVSGLNADTTAFAGNGGASSPAYLNGDHADNANLQFLPNNIFGRFAVSFAFNTTASPAGFICGQNKSGSFTDFYQFGMNDTSGDMQFLRSINGGNFQAVLSDQSTDLNTGDDIVVIIQSLGNDASDIEMYFTPNNDQTRIEDNRDQPNEDGFTNPTNFTVMARAKPSIDDSFEGSMTNFILFNDALTLEEREGVFDLYPFYDPATDAP
jgi:hypothetical protein